MLAIVSTCLLCYPCLLTKLIIIIIIIIIIIYIILHLQGCLIYSYHVYQESIMNSCVYVLQVV